MTKNKTQSFARREGINGEKLIIAEREFHMKGGFKSRRLFMNMKHEMSSQQMI